MIQGGTTLPQNNEVGKANLLDVVIDGDEIIALGSHLDPDFFGIEKILSAQDKLIIPGLVNGHLHSHDRFDKGRFDNLPLEVWMGLYNPPITSREWNARECYLRTMLSCIEVIRCGTTTVLDDLHPGFPLAPECVEAVFQAYQDVGLRARVSVAYSDKPYYETIPYLEGLLPERLKQTSGLSPSRVQDMVFELWRSFAQKWKDRVCFILSPSGPQRCSDGFLKKTWNFSEEFGLPVIVHVLETKVQAVSGQLFYGKSIVEHMHELGLLTPLTALVHAVWLNDNEISLIAKAGSSIIHNPLSNTKLGSGIAPVIEMLEAGINVGLGTDNHNASDTPNMFEAMKLAALLHKGVRWDYKRWVGAKHVFEMATQGSAKCGGMQGRIGKLEVGTKADMVLIDLNQLSFIPPNNLLHQLVFCEHGESVDTVIVDGKVIMEKGQITTVNEPEILEQWTDQAVEIANKISRTEVYGKKLEPYLRQAYLRCLQQ